MIDAMDRKILTNLREDARTSAAEVARRVGMAPSAVFERIKRLEARKVVRAFVAVVNPREVGYGVLAFVAVSAREGSGCAAVGQSLAQIPGVQEVHHIAGSDDYLVKIRAEDAEALGRLLRDRFKAIPGVRSTRTTVVLDTLKETPTLDLPGEKPAAAAPVATVVQAPAANGAANGHARAARVVKGR
jgi:Lrp/AsnC family leucine-responsive transcriptional regulator